MLKFKALCDSFGTEYVSVTKQMEISNEPKEIRFDEIKDDVDKNNTELDKPARGKTSSCLWNASKIEKMRLK